MQGIENSTEECLQFVGSLSDWACAGQECTKKNQNNTGLLFCQVFFFFLSFEIETIPKIVRRNYATVKKNVFSRERGKTIGLKEFPEK